MTNLIVHKKSRSLLLPASHADLIAVLPRARLVELHGRGVVQVRHCEEATRILRAEGFDVPAPIECYYSFKKVKNKYEVLAHQIQTSAFFSLNPKCITTNGLGTGKTHAILSYVDYALENKIVDRVIIIAPLSVTRSVWDEAIFSDFHNRTASVLLGTAARRKEMLYEDTDIKIINVDGVTVLKNELTKWVDDRTLVVYDEASLLKSGRGGLSERTKLFMKLVNKNCRVILSSATPMPNNPSESWSLCRIINPDAPKYYSHYRDLVEYKINQFDYAPKKDNALTVAKFLQPCIHFDKSDVLGLPPMTTERRDIPLSDEQKKHLKTLKNQMLLELEPGNKSLAQNAAVVFGKVLQVLLGVIKTEDGEYKVIDGFKSRIDEVMSIAEERGAKILVSVTYKGALQYAHKEISKHFACEYVNGDVDSKTRTDIFWRFQNTNDIRILLVHPVVASHGINLQSCDTLVTMGPIASGDLWGQLQGRISRIGQENPMTVIQLAGDRTEHKIYDKLNQRHLAQADMLDIMKEWTQERL